MATAADPLDALVPDGLRASLTRPIGDVFADWGNSKPLSLAESQAMASVTSDPRFHTALGARLATTAPVLVPATAALASVDCSAMSPAQWWAYRGKMGW